MHSVYSYHVYCAYLRQVCIAVVIPCAMRGNVLDFRSVCIFAFVVSMILIRRTIASVNNHSP